MKTRIFSFLLVLVMAVGMLASCGGGNNCTTHTDANGDLKCDTCQTPMSCTNHVDSDHNQKCDKCKTAVPCEHEIDEDGYCAWCDFVQCVKHVDRDHNLICDNEGCEEAVACEKHADADENAKCDWCAVAFSCPLAEHKDETQDGKCDGCLKVLESFNFPWTSGTLTFEMTDNSNGQELPSGCRNWMAGETTDSSNLTAQAAVTRNDAALVATKLTIKYEFVPDNDPEYDWGANYERINTKQSNGIYFDMYCNFAYDMIGASLLGCFANLKTTKTTNYFEFAGDDDYADTIGDTRGYMYEYMTSLSIDESKMYLVASDYFIDMIRAFYCVPMDIALFNDLATQNILGSIEGKNYGETVTDFAQAVLDGYWTYDLLLKYCQAYGDATVNSDKMGFAIAQHSLSAAGLLYTTSVRLFTDARKDPGSNWVHDINAKNSPYSYADQNATFEAVVKELQDMVTSSGVVRFTSNDKFGLATNLLAIREKFTDHKVLFGGVILLGSLEYQDYQDMKTEGGEGFLVVPVPLYTDYNEATNDIYSTQIHNVGRIGAISVKTTKFAECSAFLNYQSTHSRAVRDTYYNHDLLYSVVGGADDTIFAANKQMLDLLRESLITGFDKAYEDSSALFSPKESVDTQIEGTKYFEQLKWHDILERGGYERANDIRTYYDALKAKKTELMGRLFNNGYTMLPE